MNASLLQGTCNTRDLGILLPGGHPLRLLRSDHLAGLTEEDGWKLREWNIVRILDLRRFDERVKQPTPAFVYAQAEIVTLTIDNTPLFAVRRNDPTFRLAELYLHMLKTHGALFARAVEWTVESLAQNRGVLFHCSAGKDRTGLLAALILLCAGVPRWTVVEDYLRTRSMLGEKSAAEIATIPSNTNPAFYQALLGCERDAIETALDELDRLGGARAWLLACGAAQETLDWLTLRT